MDALGLIVQLLVFRNMAVQRLKLNLRKLRLPKHAWTCEKQSMSQDEDHRCGVGKKCGVLLTGDAVSPLGVSLVS